jgi:hypothetical protein
MQRARVAAIAIGALVAVTAALLAASWMSGRARSGGGAEGEASASGTEVEIEIPTAAGPATAARIEGAAPLDPGKAVDAGGLPAEVEAMPSAAQRPSAVAGVGGSHRPARAGSPRSP